VNHDNQIQCILHHYSPHVDWRAYKSVRTSRDLFVISLKELFRRRKSTLEQYGQQYSNELPPLPVRGKRNRRLWHLNVRLRPSLSAPRHVERHISYSDWSQRVRHDTTSTRLDYLLLHCTSSTSSCFTITPKFISTMDFQTLKTLMICNPCYSLFV